MADTLPLVCEIAGDGDPVVMIHGLGGTSNTFQPLMQALAGYRTIRPDLTGSGRTPWPVQPLSIAGHAADIQALCRAIGVTRAHFLGHSMGTLVCQHLAVAAPELVASLALFGALTEPTEAARAGLGARAALVREQGMAPVADQIATNTLAPRAHEDNPAAVAFVRESILRQPPEGYARNCEALALARVADLARIKAPVLLVTGDSDPVAPPSMARLLADRIGGATLKMLDRCGHWSTMESPRPCAGLAAEFLGRQRI